VLTTAVCYDAKVEKGGRPASYLSGGILVLTLSSGRLTGFNNQMLVRGDYVLHRKAK